MPIPELPTPLQKSERSALPTLATHTSQGYPCRSSYTYLIRGTRLTSHGHGLHSRSPAIIVMSFHWVEFSFGRELQTVTQHWFAKNNSQHCATHCARFDHGFTIHFLSALWLCCFATISSDSFLDWDAVRANYKIRTMN